MKHLNLLPFFSMAFCFTCLSVSESRADIFSSGSTVIAGATYGCIGFDGIPIQAGSALDASCCSGGELNANADSATCRSGFASITGDSGASAYTYNQLAQQALGVAQNLNGTVADASASITPSPTPIAAVTNAITSSGDNTPNLVGTQTDTGAGISPTTAASTADSGSGSGGSGSGGGSGSSLGTVGGTSAASEVTENSDADAAADAGNAAQSKASGFVANSGNGKTGASGSGMDGLFGNLFASKDSGKVGDGEIKGELRMGDLPNGISNGPPIAEEDRGATANDPDDYFSRIDKSANLFKIVSNRYFKKKSLWKVKPESAMLTQ
jgi:hypothetical protein